MLTIAIEKSDPNEIGDLLAPRVAILLIVERPGLATADSLSSYMAYQPGRNQTDADRNSGA